MNYEESKTRVLLDERKLSADGIAEAFKGTWDAIAHSTKSANVQAFVVAVAQRNPENGRIDIVQGLIGKPDLLAFMLRKLEETQCYNEQEQDEDKQAADDEARSARLVELENEARSIAGDRLMLQSEEADLTKRLEVIRSEAHALIHSY